LRFAALYLKRSSAVGQGPKLKFCAHFGR